MSTPVLRIIQILDVISQSETGIGVNKIVKATGESKRKNTIEIIKELRKNGLIERINKKGQIKIMKLTELGSEILEIKKDSDTILDAFDKLPKLMGDYFKNIKAEPDAVIAKDKDIRKLYGFLVCARHDFPFNFISTLLSRYFEIAYKYNPSKKTLEWLNQIVIEDLLHILSNKSHHIRTFDIIANVDHGSNDPAAVSVIIDELTNTGKNGEYLEYLRSAFKGMKASKTKEIHDMQILATSFYDSFNSLWAPARKVWRLGNGDVKYDERDNIWSTLTDLVTDDHSKRNAVTAVIAGLYTQLSLEKRDFLEKEVKSKLLEIPGLTDEVVDDYLRWARYSSLIYEKSSDVYVPQKPKTVGAQMIHL